MGFEIFVMGYNSILCDLTLLLMIWDSKAEFLSCSFVYYANVLMFYVLGLDSCVVASESIFGLDVVYCLGYFMLRVVSMVIAMVIGVDIEMHDIKKMITSSLIHHANGNPFKTWSPTHWNSTNTLFNPTTNHFQW